MTTIPIADDVHSTVPVALQAPIARATDPGADKPSKAHLPALDGVRAIAILMVVVYHSLNGLPGVTPVQSFFLDLTGAGWVGVDLFFVLSGFLITGILMDVRSPDHALRNFYARRVLRIVPVYVAFLLFSLWIAAPLGTSSAEEVSQLHRTQLWFWTYTENVLVALHSWSATSFPMAHLWSLAVEEQFYLVWPIAVLLLSPAALKRAAVACIVAAELCRLALILRGADNTVNFVMLPTRMDSLAAGAFLACAFRNPVLWSRVLRARKWLATVATLSLLSLLFLFHSIDKLVSLDQLIAFPSFVALGAVAVASAANGSQWLSGSALRFIGKISYGMYVWHLVVMRLILTQVSVPETTAPQAWWIFYAVMAGGTVCGTVVVALISWHVIEQPFLRLKRFVPSG
jgi:peptidoglycan/LPS O-acetylase OafA/YrhL